MKVLSGKGWPGAASALTLALAVSVTGCGDSECDGNKNTLPLAGFYSGSEPEQAVAIDSVQIIGRGVAGGEAVLSGYATGTSQVYLPFKIDSDTTSFIFNYRQKELDELHMADTVTFIYHREPYFESEACGVVCNFRMEKILTTHTFIDSVGFLQPVIDNYPKENLRIYFRVSAEPAPDPDENEMQ